MNDSAQQFYDLLAEDYHLIFTDWAASVERQAQILHALIQQQTPQPPSTVSVLDCSCGIGTQAIGLAQLGYRVTATDLSPKAVERAAAEAEKAGVTIKFGVADFCRLAHQVTGRFDVVLSFDNSLPHLLEDREYRLAFQNIRAKLGDTGLVMASIRDYDRILAEKPAGNATLTPATLDDNRHGRRVSFQVWEWEDRIYTMNHFIIKKENGEWETRRRATRYRAILRSEINGLLSEAGFREIVWRMPEDTGFYQPIVTARPG